MGALVQVDAFTDRLFGGNPCCVVLLDTPTDDADWMQALAAETGMPATAFVAPLRDGQYGLRWFAPGSELTLCGHGTLSSAHVLFERDPALTEVGFETREAGKLLARRRGTLIELDFPGVRTEPVSAPPELIAALAGHTLRTVERGHFDYLVELESESAVRDLHPDLVLLRKLETRGVIVTARAESDGADFVSRFFAPRIGIGEDAVTGSAHCALGPYWASRLGRTELVGLQLSKRRGIVHVRVENDGRVTLGGQAVTVMRGRLASDPLEDWYQAQARLVAAFPGDDLKGAEPPLVSTPGPA